MAYHEELVMILINRYFINLTSILIINNSSFSSETSEHYLNAAQASFQNLAQQRHPIGLHWINIAGLANQSDLNELLLKHVDMGIQGYIIILSSVVEFLYSRWYASEHSVLRLKDIYYLFLTENENPTDVLAHEILKLYPHHLLVSVAKNYTGIELWTQKFVGTNGNLDAMHLDTFFVNGSFDKNVELFPNKLLDMQGRTLAVASFTYIPYVVSYFVGDNSGNVDSIDPTQPRRSFIYTGIEAELVLTFCQLRNCVVKVMLCKLSTTSLKGFVFNDLPLDGKDNWGGVYENGSSDGIIGSVYQRETELTIGAYYNWYNDIFETSIAIAKSAVTILGPAPSLYPAYMTIVLPFNKLIWSLIILSMIVGSFVMYGIKYFSFRMDQRRQQRKASFEHISSYRLTLLQIVAIFFQQSFSQTKLDRFAARFFLSTLLLAGVILENTYSGQLKSLLTIPIFTDPVDTIEKFASTNWKWAAPSPVWSFSIASSNTSYEQIMAKKFQVLSYEQLKTASYMGNYGLALERLHGGKYGFGDFIKDAALDKMILMKDDLYYEWTRAIAFRGWPLMNEFNMYILWCLEHGFYNYWESKHVVNLMDKSTENIISTLASGHQEKSPPMSLSIANISGPLLALVIGYCLAFLSLLLEVIGNKILRK